MKSNAKGIPILETENSSDDQGYLQNSVVTTQMKRCQTCPKRKRTFLYLLTMICPKKTLMQPAHLERNETSTETSSTSKTRSGRLVKKPDRLGIDT